MNDCIFSRRQMNAVLFESEWETLKCNDCGGTLELEVDNDFESVKVCKDCGTKILLIKKLREEKE